MSERALRGTRLGATSYETDNGIDLAPRQDVEYSCPNGHRFQMPFSVEAEVPMMWECRVCGAQALRVGGTLEEDKPTKPARTHWDMLLERRSIPELEEVLAERLALLRDGGFSGARMARPPVNLSTGAPQTGASAGAQAGAAAAGTASATAAPRQTAAKKTVAKKTTAGTAPAKKTAASKAAPATKAADKPTKKTAAKKPSAK